jgi:hypothetical protein
MVRRRSVALPSLSPRPRSRHRDLTGRPLSGPVWPPPDRSTSPYLSRLEWPLCLHWSIKGKPSRGVAIAKSRQISSSIVSPLLFSLRLVFGQPLLAHLYHCSAHSPSKLFCHLRRQPPEAARKKIERRAPAYIADHASVRGDARVPPLDACRYVSLHRRQSLSSFSFSYTHPSPASSWTALRQWGERQVSFAPSEFSLSRSVSEYVFHVCNLCHVGRRLL